MDWLDNNILINGQRNGNVKLWDVRTSGYEGTSYPIQHSSSITHVKKINENKIVVAGREDKLCIYDLRFLKGQPTAPPIHPTRPYLDFPTYTNWELDAQNVGFDVCKGVIAAATDHGRVQFLDIDTGLDVCAGFNNSGT